MRIETGRHDVSAMVNEAPTLTPHVWIHYRKRHGCDLKFLLDDRERDIFNTDIRAAYVLQI